ncbi:methyl-accepting chemotaxis protein [Roseateles aquae]|nr:methyl-accepting chemotaxis protein [Paucibacter sp. APW11]
MRFNSEMRHQVAAPAMAGLEREQVGWGARLLMRLSFKAKALCISLAFGVPLLCLMLCFIADAQKQLDGLRLERSGVQLLRALGEVQQGLLLTRNATRARLGGLAVDGAAGQHQLEQGLKQLAQAIDAAPAALRLGPAHAQLVQVWQQAARTPGGVDEQGRTVYGPVTAALKELLQTLGDNSSLVLDPELDSFYLVNALVLTLPALEEDVGQLWGWSSYAQARGGLPDAELKRYQLWHHGAVNGLSAMRGHVSRAQGARPALHQRLPLQGLDGLQHYLAAVAQPTEASATNAAERFAQGEQALRGLQAFGRQGLDALDGLLQEREAELLWRRQLVLGLTLVCLALAAYLFRAFFIAMHSGFARMRRQMDAMRNGDLSQQPANPGRDEVTALMQTLAELQLAWQGIVARVRDSSQAIVSASGEMSAGAEDLSSRTERSAASLQQSAAAMEQISATVRQTAEHAGEAEQMAAGTAGLAQRGSAQIELALQRMASIDQAAREIADITGLIDSIAFQTNILSLNAAVEAARAGEHGRGFAVVAAEVRALAARAGEAARQIKTLTSASLGQVEQGHLAVREADQTLQQLAGRAGHVQALLSEIAVGARQQSEGVVQVGGNVQELDRLTQQNAALVEQAAAATAALRHEALALSDGVMRFRLP